MTHPGRPMPRLAKSSIDIALRGNPRMPGPDASLLSGLRIATVSLAPELRFTAAILARLRLRPPSEAGAAPPR